LFLKLAVSILSIGLTAAALLSLRQLRLQAVHESANVQRRIADHDRLLWKLRGDIASHITPDRVRKMTGKLGPMVHLNDPRQPKPTDTGLAGEPASLTPAVPRVSPSTDR